MEVDPRIVLPGDVIDVDEASTIVLGPGLRQEGDQIVAMKAGILQHLEVGNRYWIESNQKRVRIYSLLLCETIGKYWKNSAVVYCSHRRVRGWHSDCQDGRVFPCRHWNSTFSRPAHAGIWRRHKAQQAQLERAVARLLQSVHGKSRHGARARMCQSQNWKGRRIWWIGGRICD